MSDVIDYGDERFADVESDKNQALTEIEQLYGSMVGKSEKYYEDMVENAKTWTEAKSQTQQAQTDFTIEQIEQQKEQAQKDYLKEQSGAYTDWKKEGNKYAAGAEQMVAAGLTNSGYGESSQVNIYNTYQNRVATARESYELAVLNYNNAIKEARIQNSSVLADIAYQGLQMQLELALQGFQYENELLLNQLSTKMAIEDTYYNRYLDVLAQLNTENALKEQQRQFNLSHDLDIRQYQPQEKELNAALEQKQEASIKKTENTGSDATVVRNSSGVIIPSSEDEKSTGSLKTGIYRTLVNNRVKPISEFGNETHKVNTIFYEGDLNPDVKSYGTFSNGYQPKGVGAHGYLEKTGDTVTVHTVTLSGAKKEVEQNVWKAHDGTYWYWDGRENKYKEMGPNYQPSREAILGY